MELLLLPIVGLYGLVALVAWSLGLVVRSANTRHRRAQRSNKQTIIAAYTPPPDVSPAELAYLYDQAVGSPEYLATVFDLENRQYLQLRSEGRGRFVAVATKQPITNLQAFEAYVYADAQLHSFDSKSYDSWIERYWGSQFEYLLQKQLENRGLLLASRRVSRSWNITRVVVVAFAALWGFFCVKFGASIDTFEELDTFLGSIMTVTVVVVVACALLPFLRFAFLVYERASRIAHSTSQLDALWPAIEGYKTYVEVVDLDEIQFANEHEKEKAQNEVAAYAVALNLTTLWERRFG